MSRRSDSSSPAPEAFSVGDAVWLGAGAAAAIVDAILSRHFGAAHLVFAACAATPVMAGMAAASRQSMPAARLAVAIVWIMAAVVLMSTAGERGAAFAAWLALPTAAVLARGRRGREVLEALGLTLLAAAAIFTTGLAEGEGLGWSYGVMPLASALAVAAYVALAAARAARNLERGVSRHRMEARRLAATIAASPDVFWRIDAAGRIMSGEGGGPAKFAATPEDAIGLGASEMFDPSERARVDQALERVRRFGGEERLVLRSHDGLAEAHLSRPSALEVILAVRPASDEVKAFPAVERERDAAQTALRARTRFIAGISHELRTPLNAVLGFSDAMREKLFGPLPAKYAEYAELIHESAKHLLDLVGDLLDITRIEAGRYQLEMSRFDASESVRAVARMLQHTAEAKNVSLRAADDDAPIDVFADARALKQMLINLASNALKFTEEGGEVWMSARAEGNELVAVVRDTGPGLSEDEIGQIGRPFEQTDTGRRHEGRSSGLGLALVRSLCELHGGRLHIESELGAGAAFQIRLPVLAHNNDMSEPMDARGRLQRVKNAGFAAPPESSEKPE